MILVSAYILSTCNKVHAEVDLNVTEAIRKDVEYPDKSVEGNTIDTENSEQLMKVPDENPASINWGTKDIARRILIEWLRRGLRIFGGCVFADCRDQSNSTTNTNSNNVEIRGNSGGVFSGHIG